MYVFEILCHPPNEASRVVKIEAATIEQAMTRANALWCRQMRPPQLLAAIDQAPQVPLAF
jgi:hypothetical protein